MQQSYLADPHNQLTPPHAPTRACVPLKIPNVLNRPKNAYCTVQYECTDLSQRSGWHLQRLFSSCLYTSQASDSNGVFKGFIPSLPCGAEGGASSHVPNRSSKRRCKVSVRHLEGDEGDRMADGRVQTIPAVIIRVHQELQPAAAVPCS